MSSRTYSIVILGLSITSSWGNGHATTYRGLVRALADRGHDVLFLERNMPWYAANRDLPLPPYGRTQLYDTLEELRDRFATPVRDADLVMMGSFVPEGAAVGDWVLAEAQGVRAFYDIDTPVTLGKLERGEHDYLRPAQVPRYDLYLSFTGGRTLQRLERDLGARAARAFYCAVDPDAYFPESLPHAWDLGYMGTYSADRRPTMEALLLAPARAHPRFRFVIAGPQYPDNALWPENVQHIAHLPPAEHRAFYSRQRYTLNVTRADMVAAGWSPSVRLFEAAACGTPVISDCWAGIEDILVPGREILLVRSSADVVRVLQDTPENERRAICERARAHVLAAHTAAHRACELEHHLTVARERAAA